MKVASVNLGLKCEKVWRGGAVSAIHKEPVADKVQINEYGLVGDEQADTQNHGGKDKAILVLPSSAYVRFEISQPYGFLGENLSVDGLDENDICLGDRLQIGNVLLEISQPRSPCWKLDEQARIHSKWLAGEFLNAYSQSGHVGFYCRVLGKGFIEKGQSVRWLTRNQEQDQGYPLISIRTLFLAVYNQQKDTLAWSVLEKAVKHPALAKAWRNKLTAMLEQATI